MKEKTLQTRCPHCGAGNRISRDELSANPACSQCRRPLLPAQVLKLTDEEFPALLKNEAIPWVIDFWAPWCAPCKRMAPAFEDLARGNQTAVRFAKINVELYPSLAQRKKIQSIPTLVCFQGNKELGRLTGLQSKSNVQRWLDSTLPGKRK